MSIALQMVQANVPLCRWRSFDLDSRSNPCQAKHDSRKIAGTIVKQLGHPEVVDLIAKEFSLFPEQLRIDFRTLANDQQSCSGNVRKGLHRLNDRLLGQLMRQDDSRTFNKRVETRDGVIYRRQRINESVAGAKRKYQIV